MQAYSNPKRESEPHSLPDVEVWDSHYVECPECSNLVLYNNARSAACPACERVFAVSTKDPVGWFWWTCLPGCLPDSEPMGPFETRELALADAQDGADEESFTDIIECEHCHRIFDHDSTDPLTGGEFPCPLCGKPITDASETR